MRGGNSIHKGIKRNTTTQVIQVSPDGQHERENTLTTELPSSDYACQYAKDKLTGRITCMVCGEEGHYTCDCSMKNQEKKVVCTLCNRVGHCHLWCCRQNVSENRACAVVVKKDTTPRRSSVFVVKSVVILRTSVAPAVIQTMYLENVLWEALHVSFVKAKIMCLHNAA